MATCTKCGFDNPTDTRFCGNCAAPLEPVSGERVLQTQTLRTSFQQFPMGTTFAGRYQVIEELGKGGMGSVYKVYDAEVEEKVALKLLNPEIASDEETSFIKTCCIIRSTTSCGETTGFRSWSTRRRDSTTKRWLSLGGR